MQRITLAIFLGLLVGLALPVQAACPGPEALAAYAAEFGAAKKSQGFGKQITEAEAECARNRLAEALMPVMGAPVGYKAVFTNPDAQKRFGVSGPAWGTMYGRWMFRDGVRLPKGFGALQRFEADFMVVVKDGGLAEAKTPLEALKHIDFIVPFIELPDLMLEGKITGPELIATNSAFRGGVMGEPIAVKPSPALLAALAEMEVIVVNETDGKEIGREKGSVLMDQPLNAAIWLANALKKDGIKLKQGDLLSLGGYLGSKPIIPGGRASVIYKGLPGDPKVTVSFE
ncbi:MAG: hydratase [Rhodospirillales bacterium]|nr:hydratase [Rhodospirillales bacterium]